MFLLNISNIQDKNITRKIMEFINNNPEIKRFFLRKTTNYTEKDSVHILYKFFLLN